METKLAAEQSGGSCGLLQQHFRGSTSRLESSFIILFKPIRPSLSTLRTAHHGFRVSQIEKKDDAIGGLFCSEQLCSTVGAADVL